MMSNYYKIHKDRLQNNKNMEEAESLIYDQWGFSDTLGIFIWELQFLCKELEEKVGNI